MLEGVAHDGCVEQLVVEDDGAERAVTDVDAARLLHMRPPTAIDPGGEHPRGLGSPVALRTLIEKEAAVDSIAQLVD